MDKFETVLLEKITINGRNEKVRTEMNVGPFGPTHDVIRVALPLPKTSMEPPDK